MRASKVALAIAAGAMCLTARADLTIDSVGDITLGNSWTVPVSLFNASAYDLLVVEVEGATFEPGGVSVTGPAGWTGHDGPSSTAGYATGAPFTGLLGLSFTFNDPPPVAAGDVTVIFSAFAPGDENPYANTAMTWDGVDGFDYPVPGTATSLTRSSLAAAPVPGALFLGAMGLGLVGFARRRLV